jgi:glycosyltransferase involved in cell wall biosynthesis
MPHARKNILFLASWFPNRNDKASGIYIKKHAFALGEHHDIFVIHICSDEKLNQKFELEYSEEKGIKILNVYYKKINGNGLFSKLLKFARYKKAFRIALGKMEEAGFIPAIIHLHVIMPMSVAALDYVRRSKLPLVITEHWSGYMKEDGLYKGRLTKYFTEGVISKAKAITVVSESLKKTMLACGLQSDYHLIPNIVEGSKTILNSKSFQPFKVGMVAAMYDRQKNISGAIDAVKKLLSENTNVELHIAGTGDDEAYLKKYCGDLLERKIFFKGYLSGPEISNFYNSVNCILVPSHFETFSVVAAEALASGVPVIAARCGGPEEFVSEDCGIVLKSNQPEGIAIGIKEMMQSYPSFDPEKISNYAKNLFSQASIIKKFGDVYEKILR